MNIRMLLPLLAATAVASPAAAEPCSTVASHYTIAWTLLAVPFGAIKSFRDRTN